MATFSLILCRGIQGSGKSTWAKAWVAENPKQRVRFNNDDIRNMAGPYSMDQEALVKFEKRAFVEKAMTLKRDIVVDNMNLNPDEVKFYEDLITQYNKSHADQYELQFKDFFIPLAECIKRDSLRPNPIGEKIIKMTYRRYAQFLDHMHNMEFSKAACAVKDKSRAIIVDIDGTIALNLNKRPYYGEGAAEGMKYDVPIDGVLEIVRNYPHTVFFVTGREGLQDVMEATMEWLKKYVGHDRFKVFYRSKGNFTSGPDCKKQIYESFIKPLYSIDFVLEDSTKVVNMWRSLDLICLQPNVTD